MTDSLEAGTYYQSIRFPPDADAHHVLFLRPSHRFLALGYWSGYEYSAAAGDWDISGVSATLTGRLFRESDDTFDTLPLCYERQFRLVDSDDGLALIADSASPSYSLLGHRGVLRYMGPDTTIEKLRILDWREWLPRTLDRVDEWIDRIHR